MKCEDDDRLKRLERDGLLVPPVDPMPLDMLRSACSPASCGVVDALIEERKEGR
jgi:hypothetical protein